MWGVAGGALVVSCGAMDGGLSVPQPLPGCPLYPVSSVLPALGLGAQRPHTS
jgi:hypothetical protein